MKKLFLLLIFLNFYFLEAQDYNFGKVSKEELSEKFNPLDSTAVATFLYKYRRTFFQYNENMGFEMITEIHERIKIYNKDGFDYATRKINLYKDGGKKERLSELRAFTYNLTNNKIEESRLKGDGEFEIELSKYYDQKTFTLPNVREGSIIEYRYRLRSPFIAIVDDFQFQHDIPVKRVLAKFEVPEYFTYTLNIKGFLPVIPKFQSSKETIVINSKSRPQNRGNTVQTTFNSSRISYFNKSTIYNLNDIPALKNEPYVNNIDNYRSSVKYELASTKFPNSTGEEYSTDWEAVVKTIYENSNFGSELNRTGYYQKELEALPLDTDDPMEKISKIFDFVKSHIKWNGYYGKYTIDGVRKAYKDHVGNVAEINLVLTSMLRTVGLNANPVLISTRDNGIPLFPTRDGYNYVISGVEVANATVLLDATSSYSTPNVLPLRALNWEGRMIKRDGTSELLNLYPKDKTMESVLMDVEVLDNGDLKGMIRRVRTGHQALYYRGEYNFENEEGYIKNLENKFGGMEISDFQVANGNDLLKPVTESYGFIKESEVEIIGNRMFFSPLFFLGTKENPFKLEKREFPVDFGYPSVTKYKVGIKIPEGYVVESLPEPARLKLPDQLGDFTFNISSLGERIQIMINSKIDEAVISPIFYDSLKEYFKIMIGKMNEKVVLSKISK